MDNAEFETIKATLTKKFDGYKQSHNEIEGRLAELEQRGIGGILSDISKHPNQNQQGTNNSQTMSE